MKKYTLLLLVVLGLSSLIYGYNQLKKPMATQSIKQTIPTSQKAIGMDADYTKFKILKEYINQDGRTEIEINMNCTSQSGNQTNLYQVNKNAKLKPNEAKYAIKGRCIMDQTETFARKITPSLNLTIRPFPSWEERAKMKQGDTYQNISTGIYYQVSDLQNGILHGDDMFETDRGPYGENPSLPIDNSAKAYELGIDKALPISSVRKGAIVMPIELVTNVMTSENGSDAKERKVVAIIILPDTPELKWYSPNMINSISPVQTCEGNPQDRCVDGGIDLFPVGQGEDNVNRNFARVDYPPKKNDHVMKAISGKLTEIHDTYVKIKSSSGKVFTIKFGSDPTYWFNEHASGYHNNIQIKLGDIIIVRYSEKPDQHKTTIENKHIMNASFAIEMTSKYDPVKKY